MIAIPTGERTEKGKKKYKFIGACNPDNKDLPNLLHNGAILIPCGQCTGCRLDRSREWADRMMLELQTAKKAIFLTLTYDDAHVPKTIGYIPIGNEGEVEFEEYFTLKKKDLQDFLKRFRERKEFNDKRIRFYGCGEYGSEKYTCRPHYHLIIFGVGLDDINDKKFFRVSPKGDQYWVSDLIADIWQNGQIILTNVSWETCAYVARYVMKKLKGVDSQYYIYTNRVPEFSVMSLKPGIGYEYLKENPDCLQLVSIPIGTEKEGLNISLPKYYIRQLDTPRKECSEIYVNFYDPEKYKHLKNLRKRFSDDRMLQELFKQNKQLEEYLGVHEANHDKAKKILDKYRNKV